MLLIKLYFTIMFLCILGVGVFEHLAQKSQKIDEEIEWRDYSTFCVSVFFTFLGMGGIGLIWIS